MASGVYQGNKQNKVLYKAFSPSGRRAKCADTQGDALGYELLPLQGVWGKPKGCSRNIHYTWSGFNSSSVNPVICMI